MWKVLLATAALTTACASATTFEPQPMHPLPAQSPPSPAVTITCYDENAQAATFHDVADAWHAARFGHCEAAVTGALNGLQRAALTTAYGRASSNDGVRLGGLYGICAQSGADNLDVLRYAAPVTVAKTRGALVLCRDHPDRTLIKALLVSAQARNRLVAAGRIFPDGDYRVGEQVPPGTYYVRDVRNCYWQRTGRSGKILGNAYVAHAVRVTATIAANDYAFHSERCGEWQPVS